MCHCNFPPITPHFPAVSLQLITIGLTVPRPQPPAPSSWICSSPSRAYAILLSLAEAKTTDRCRIVVLTKPKHTLNWDTRLLRSKTPVRPGASCRATEGFVPHPPLS